MTTPVCVSELKEAQRRQQQMKERVRQEEVISNATLVWNQLILPQWDTMYDHSLCVCVCVVSQLHHENANASLFPDPIN